MVNGYRDYAELSEIAMAEGRWDYAEDSQSGMIYQRPRFTKEEEEELNNWFKAVRENAEAKRAEQKAKRDANELAKAEALGVSLEEYKKIKVLKAKKSRYANEIRKYEEEIERLNEEIAYRKKMARRELKLFELFLLRKLFEPRDYGPGARCFDYISLWQ